jgi:hypothetical protein
MARKQRARPPTTAATGWRVSKCFRGWFESGLTDPGDTRDVNLHIEMTVDFRTCVLEVVVRSSKGTFLEMVVRSSKGFTSDARVKPRP